MAGSTGAGIRVVLADDTPDVRVLLRYALELDGRFEVVGEAADGQAAVDLATEATPDAVVLDLTMPGLQGLEVLPRLRASVPSAHIVVLSAHDAADMAELAMARGAAAYVEKTAAMAELADVLVRLCAPPPAAP